MTVDQMRAMLQEEMELQGVTANALAQHIGIASSTLYRFLAGESQMRLDTLDELVAALGMRWSVRLVRR